MSRVDWAELDRLLDELLDLPEPDRGPRLEELSADRPRLAAALRRALDDAATVAPVEERFPELLDFDAPAAAVPASPSERIGAYRIRELLGEGGMGTVFLAERADGSFEQTVALKILRRRVVSPGVRARFLQERQLLARLSHPRIARLLDGGVTPEGEPFFAMERVVGKPIDRHCDERRATVDERLELFDQVLDAVQFAHRNLVLHRDLKPGNILVTSEGDVKLLDFGVAKLLEVTPDAALTVAGDQWLTPDYASPEQLAGEPVSTASDVYSLGVLLHELLTGVHPFIDLKGAQRRAAILEGRIPRISVRLRQVAPEQAREIAARRSASPRALAAALRGDLEAILARATRREPEERYRSIEAFRSDLTRYRTGYPVEAARGDWLYATRKFWRRHRLAVAGAVVVVTSLAAGIGVAVHQARVARGAEARAGAISRFLTDELLGSANPEVAQGRELTVSEVVSAAERDLAALEERPEVAGSIRRTLAHVRLRLGDHEAARAQIEAAERAFEAAGESGAELAALRRIEAELALAESDLDRALDLAEEAVALAARAVGRDALTTLESRLLVGRVRSARWESIAAEAVLRDVVERLEREHPEARRTRWAALRELAEALTRQTRRTEAIERLREILALQKAALGPGHPDVGRTYGEIAGPLARLRHYDEAESAARQGLSILESAFGAAHPETQWGRCELGKVLLRARREEQAIPVFEAVLAIGAGSARGDDVAVVEAANALAVARVRQGELEEATRLYRWALTAAERLLGPGHETPSMIRRNLSNRLASIGRRSEALELAREVRRLALEAVEDPFADPMVLANNAWFLSWGAELEEARDLDTALILAERAVERSGGRSHYPLISLQDVHRARGELDEAIAASKRALELPDAQHLWGDEALLVEMLVEAGDLAGAERFLREHLVRRRELRSGEDSLAGHTRGLLGRILLLRGRLDEAAIELAAALALLDSAEGEIPRWAARARSDLGAVRERQGDLEAARAELLLAVEVLGEPSSWRRDWSDEHELAQRRLVEVSERLGLDAEAPDPSR